MISQAVIWIIFVVAFPFSIKNGLHIFTYVIMVLLLPIFFMYNIKNVKVVWIVFLSLPFYSVILCAVVCVAFGTLP
jgi:hypothetical protein